jgi:hypothetical protein
MRAECLSVFLVYNSLLFSISLDGLGVLGNGFRFEFHGICNAPRVFFKTYGDGQELAMHLGCSSKSDGADRN